MLFLIIFAPETHDDRETEAQRLDEAGDKHGGELERIRLQDLLAERLGQDLDSHQEPQRGNKRKLKGHSFYRSESQRVAYELDTALQGPGRNGGGLRKFQSPENWMTDPPSFLEQSMLLLSADQGPDVWRFQNWADGPDGRLCILREPDIWNHGVMSDCIGTALDAGQGTFLF